MKKIISIILVVALFCSLSAMAFAADDEPFDFLSDTDDLFYCSTCGAEAYFEVSCFVVDEYVVCKTFSSCGCYLDEQVLPFSHVFSNFSDYFGIDNISIYLDGYPVCKESCLEAFSSSYGSEIYHGVALDKYHFIYCPVHSRYEIFSGDSAELAAAGVSHSSDCQFCASMADQVPIYDYFYISPSASLSDIITPDMTDGALDEVITVLPVVLAILIGFIAIRKGIGFIKSSVKSS